MGSEPRGKLAAIWEFHTWMFSYQKLGLVPSSPKERTS